MMSVIYVLNFENFSLEMSLSSGDNDLAPKIEAKRIEQIRLVNKSFPGAIPTYLISI